MTQGDYHGSSNLPTLDDALASAVSDFASQALKHCSECWLTEFVSEVKVPKFGSSLSLFCTDEDKVTLYFLADKEHIRLLPEQLWVLKLENLYLKRICMMRKRNY